MKRKKYLRLLFFEEISILKMIKKRICWSIANPHNETMPVNAFDLSLVRVGYHSYGELNIVSFGNKHKLYIGNFVSIAQNVSFMLDAEHCINHISTYPFKVKTLHTTKSEAFAKGDIIVDDDVWIGYGSTIMSGVHIGQGAVIAAGAVVTKDVPPYGVVGGVPAKIIKKRFHEEIIRELLKIDYSKLTKKMADEHIFDLYQDLTNIEQLKWMPRRYSIND